MPYSSLKVDLSLIPEGPEKSTFIHFAERHNALVDSAGDLKQDIDQISGITPEEKADTHKAMGNLRKIMKVLHGHRFNFGFILMQLYAVLGITKMLGLTSDQVKHLADLLIRCLDKLVAQ